MSDDPELERVLSEDAALVDEVLADALQDENDDEAEDQQRGPSRRSQARRLALRTAEGVARAAVTVGLSMVRVVLHAPVDLLTRQAKQDVAGFAADLVGASTRTLRDRGLSQPELELTGEALVTALRLATQLSAPTLGVPPQAIFDAIKAYVFLQKFGTDLSGSNALAAEAQAQEAAAETEKERRTSLKGMLLRRFSWAAGRRETPAAKRPPVAALERGARHAFATYGKLGGKFMDALARVRTDAEALEYLIGARDDPSKEVVVCHWPRDMVGSLYRVGHFILVDHEEKEITLAVRGSFSIQDVLVDLVADDVEFAAPDSLEELLGEEDPGDGVTPDNEDVDAVRMAPVTGELDVLFRNLSTALRGVRDRLDGDGNLMQLQRSLQAWADRRSAGQLAPEEQSRASTLERAARSEEDAVQSGRANNRTHLGFLRTAKTLAREVEEVLADTVRKHSSYKLVLVGHSLGAAVATLLTFMWAKHPQLRKAECLGIAAPPSLSLDLAASPLAMKKIHNVVLADDVVPRLSLGSVFDVRDAIVYMHEHGLTQQVLDAVADPSRNDPRLLRETFAPLWARVASETHTRHKLYPAGNTWHIRDMNGTISSAVLAPPQQFGTLVLSRYMFVAHLPNYYAHACKVDEAVAASSRSLALAKQQRQQQGDDEEDID